MMDNILFFETICIKDGVLINADLHNQRIAITMSKFFSRRISIDVRNFIRIPTHLLGERLIKCRFIYDANSINVEYEKYEYRIIRRLRLVEANIEYNYKYYDRICFDKIREKYNEEDEVIITKNNFITDTTFSNIVFRKKDKLYTPNTYLLNGIMRQNLLRKGLINEIKITKDDIHNFDEIILINSMNDIDTQYCITINSENIIM